MEAQRTLHRRLTELHRRLGAFPLPDGSWQFRVWAPHHEQVELEVIRDGETEYRSMQRQVDGFHDVICRDLGPGMRYKYRLSGSVSRPDPASRFQPTGVHTASELVDPSSYAWADGGWRGVPKEDLVIYELHLGTFTERGTYTAAIERLNELAELGVTAVELMPLAQSAGHWNWGYDGVDFFAPHRSYGTPDELRRFVDAAHAAGLAVIVDVVYNHFGPEGNYLADFGPYLSQQHMTTWGAAPNFDGLDAARVREFFIANAIYWIDEYHCDGLRLDAIHCMYDDSEKHIVTEIGEAVGALRQQLNREVHLIAESNVYDPEMLQPLERGGHGFDGVWCDDFLHSVFAILRPGERMSNRSYQPHEDLDTTLRRGYVYCGTLREPRERVALQPDGSEESEERVPLESLIFAIQNHDFIGNHPLGQRLHKLVSIEAQKAAATLLLLHPAIPMLFMGEEFASENPFYFFVDYGDEHLRVAVEEGRRREYPQHDWSDGRSPLDRSAFERSRIGPLEAGNVELQQWYRKLLQLRRQWKARGLIRTASLNAHWDSDLHLAWLQYDADGDSAFAAVRLHPMNGAPPPLDVRVDGKILLGQYQQQEAGEGVQRVQLGDFGVVVGEGYVTVDILAAARSK